MKPKARRDAMTQTEPDYADVAKEVCRMLADEIAAEQRFLLLMFPTGNLKGRGMSFYSNADPKQMLAVLEEAADQIKGLIPPEGGEMH
jgi:hypothetical protein